MTARPITPAETVAPRPTASRRTRNRVREHAGLRPIGEPREVLFAPGPWRLFSAPDGWLGWLPAEEVDLG